MGVWLYARAMLRHQWDTTVIASAAQAVYAALVYRAAITRRTTFSVFEVTKAIDAYLATHQLPFSEQDAALIRRKMAITHLRAILAAIEETGLITRFGDGNRQIHLFSPSSQAPPASERKGERLTVPEQLDLYRHIFAQVEAEPGPPKGDRHMAARLSLAAPPGTIPFTLFQARRLRLKLIEAGELHIVNYAETSVDPDTGRWSSTCTEISSTPPATQPRQRLRRPRSPLTGVKRIQAWWRQRHPRGKGEPEVIMLAPFDVGLDEWQNTG